MAGRSSKRKRRINRDNVAVELRRIEIRGQVLSSLIKWIGTVGGLLVVSYFGIFKTVETLAGQFTVADINIGLLAKFLWGGGAVALSGGGVAYGLQQRKLRRDAIEEMGEHKAFLEAQIDPKRSSSGLTPRGDTPPEDQL